MASQVINDSQPAFLCFDPKMSQGKKAVLLTTLVSAAVFTILAGIISSGYFGSGSLYFLASGCAGLGFCLGAVALLLATKNYEK